MAMKVLITGDRGFVGTETRKYLEARGIDVVGYDLMAGKDIRDIKQLSEAVKDVDVVLHLAAVARFTDADRDPKLAFETNVLGTRNVVDACAYWHKPLVYASTGSVYMPVKQDPPITEDFPATGNSVYGCSKRMGEIYVQEHTPHIILRYAHLYGREKRGHGLIGGYWQRIQRGLAPTLYGGQQSNDFTYIRDVAMANYLAVTASWDKWNQIYNIGTGEEITAERAGELVCQATGWTGGVEKKEMREVDPMRFVYSIEKARTWLGFNPEYDFEKGIQEMFDDVKDLGAK